MKGDAYVEASCLLHVDRYQMNVAHKLCFKALFFLLIVSFYVIWIFMELDFNNDGDLRNKKIY